MKSNKRFWQGALCGALAMLLVTGSVFCGIRWKNGAAENGKANDTETQQKISELEELINQYYIGEVDKEAMTEGIYKGYLSGLSDPYSVYYDEEETKSLYEMTSGEFSGIGTLMSQNKETGIITLLRIYEDSPAMKAGLKDEDILYKVEGKEVTGENLDEVVSKIKGEKGTEVTLTVLRGEEKEEITVTITRDVIETETVGYKMLEDGIGYLAVSEFDAVTYDQYTEAIEALKAQGMKGLVVDLRNNPGGNLQTVCSMLDYVLPEGLLVYTEDKNGKREEANSDEEHQLEMPMTVLVNGNSASASEIYAGAIQDYGKGKIVGTQTYGKGVVQQIFDLKDGTCVKLTIAEYFTPNGRNINGKGITPDVEVEYEVNEENPAADNQLEKAVEVLKSEL